MQKKIIIILVAAVITGLLAWSPWITEATASSLAETQFNRAWDTVIDGCGTNGNSLGVKDFLKVPFGAYVTLDYQCGLVMPGEPALHTNIFVSFLGIAIGYPRP